MKIDQSSYIKAEKIRTLYGSTNPSSIGILIISIITSIGFYSELNPYYLLSWSTGMILIAITRLFIKAKFDKKNIKDNSKKWAHYFTINTIVAGFGWAILASFFMMTESQNYQTAIVLILIGVMGASVPLLFAYLPAFISSSLPTAISLPIIIYTQLEDTSLLLSSAVLLFISLLYFITFKSHKNLEQRLLIQYENLTLVSSLQKEVIIREDIQEKLAKHQNDLEDIVTERTKQLESSNIELQNEINERKEAEVQIRILSQAVEQSPISIAITDPSSNIEYVNNAFLKISGYSYAEIIGKKPSILQSGKTPLASYKALWEKLNAGDSWQGEFQNISKNGTLFWENVHISPILNKSGEVRHYLALKEDITLQKKQQETIQYQANYDLLTKLPNRFLILDRLTQQLLEAKRNGTQVAVIFLDLDNFKRINESLGHNIGDKLLVEATERLTRSARSGDTVGRSGGDEFVVILGGLSTQAERPVIENLLRQFREPFRLNARDFVMTVSMGISIFPDDGVIASELLQNADSAMYHSKDLGKNTYSYFTDTMNQEVSRSLELDEQMYGALKRKEFHVVYQPQINIESGNIIGAEALLRWTNPVLGIVRPDEFIAIAEQTGLIIEIGKFVLKEAISNLPEWKSIKGGQFRVAVNLSPNQFRDPTLVDFISDELNQLNIQGKSLELEITEGVLMSGNAYIEEAIENIVNLKIALAMDDFGTGYSSLSYLRRYPFNILKIDKSFIDEISTDPADMELVSATISMAHGLGLKVIAEGVETKEQLTLLQDKQCDYVQGFFYSPPLSKEKFKEKLML